MGYVQPGGGTPEDENYGFCDDFYDSNMFRLDARQVGRFENRGTYGVIEARKTFRNVQVFVSKDIYDSSGALRLRKWYFLGAKLLFIEGIANRL